MTLLSRLTVEQIQSVMQVNQETISLTMMLSKPSPPLSAKHVQTVNDRWQQDRVHFHQLVARAFLGHGANQEVDMALQFGAGAAVFEPFETYGDELGALESELLDKSSKYHKAVLKASQKIGIPKTTADMNADSFMRTTFVRNAVNAAGINMAATALFDIKTLFDADFQNYFLKLCISGAYGSAVSACSSQIDHRIFGYGAVVGVIVGSLFNMASLAPTGDWSRFGKNTGLSMVSSAGGWGGAELGAMAGTAVGGPIGGLLGRLVGGLGGGFAG
ncbi:uncharacterized protein FMAN_14087 [Fusarium mangiferae]|uniref:Uncharacterized protein n=1 Tax=Fusarium mangiferae TaxID=192010 RepID=A0A1L7UMX6_FUSMA|nr:uncharacterized protein FMAN_14087 [Fusarium mangiferae]CVL08841.1 uncharacterized protein FMAN_14087 [Fusarium mangiferae]